MSVWYFATALIKASPATLAEILKIKESNAEILLSSKDRVLLEEFGRNEGLSDWAYDVGIGDAQPIVFVNWTVEADVGGNWGMRGGKLVYEENFEYQGCYPAFVPVTEIQRWASALKRELCSLKESRRAK